jgi:hypothetical protein
VALGVRVDLGIEGEARHHLCAVADDAEVPEEESQIVVVAVPVEAGRVLAEHVGIDVFEDSELIVAAGRRYDAPDLGVFEGFHHVRGALLWMVAQPLAVAPCGVEDDRFEVEDVPEAAEADGESLVVDGQRRRDDGDPVARREGGRVRDRHTPGRASGSIALVPSTPIRSVPVERRARSSAGRAGRATFPSLWPTRPFRSGSEPVEQRPDLRTELLEGRPATLCVRARPPDAVALPEREDRLGIEVRLLDGRLDLLGVEAPHRLGVDPRPFERRRDRLLVAQPRGRVGVAAGRPEVRGHLAVVLNPL